jgi:hypothetical protein
METVWIVRNTGRPLGRLLQIRSLLDYPEQLAPLIGHED